MTLKANKTNKSSVQDLRLSCKKKSNTKKCRYSTISEVPTKSLQAVPFPIGCDVWPQAITADTMYGDRQVGLAPRPTETTTSSYHQSGDQ